MDRDDDSDVPSVSPGWEDSRDEERGLDGGYTSGPEGDVLEAARRQQQRPSRGPRAYRRPDPRILEDLCDRLFGDTGADASEVMVEVSNGVVILTGTTPDPEDKRRIVRVANGVLGVERVEDRIGVTVREPEPVEG